jgi:hypothetical protein
MLPTAWGSRLYIGSYRKDTGRRGSTGRWIPNGVGEVFAVVRHFPAVGCGLDTSYSWRSIHRRCKVV